MFHSSMTFSFIGLLIHANGNTNYNFQDEWYNICMDALNNVDKLYQGKDAAQIIQSKVLQVYNLVSHLLIEIQRIKQFK